MKRSSSLRHGCVERARNQRVSRSMARKPSDRRIIGTALRKIDAVAKVTGTTRFADDLAFPRMLYCKLLRATHPHARVVSIDASAARIAEGDVVREDLFFFEGNTHLPMEQHAAVAVWSPDGKLTLWSSTQTPHYVHRALAKVLELPPARVRVIATPNGGGFGGKSDPFNHEIAVAKLAMLTGRPVKITLTREEVFYCHRGRHPTLMWVRTGVKKTGAT